MTVQELIRKYDIFDPQDGRIGMRNKGAVMRDSALTEITARKPEILAYFASEREKKAAFIAERERRIAEIEGLAEIEDAISALAKWECDFERSFEGDNACGGMGVGQKPNVDIDALKAKYPRAAAYLKAEEKSLCSNYELAAIGKKALEEVIYGDYQKAMDDMQKDIDAFVARHFWD